MWMPSLDLATGLWARMRRTLYTLFSRLSRAAQRFWMSRAYFPVLLTVSAAFMAAGEPVYGVAALGCIVIWLLAACPDLLAPVCPFFMAFLMSSQCYGQLTDFLPCAALVPPLLVALLWHFAVWPVTLRIGRSGLGLALVSIATLLGGCDVISRKQAMEPLSLYYTLGLGVGMLVLYVLFRSHLTEKRSYDLHRRFAEIFCALGLCMALAVLLAYGKAWLAEGHIGGVLYLSYRNFATSVLLTALPMPFYLSLRHRGHLATAAVLALALALTGIGDMERLVGRIVYGTAGGRDVVALKNAMARLPHVKELLSAFDRGRLGELAQLDTLEDLTDLIGRTLCDDPPFSVREGEFIREGFDPEVDRLRSILHGGKGVIASMEAAEKEKTGIRTLKIGYNKVFGYYIEVSNSFKDQVPDTYIRKQTLVNGERYITQELKDLEHDILSASDRVSALEYELFTRLRQELSGHVARLQAALDGLGLDGSHRLVVVLMQLVNLLQDGQPVRMSKRSGKAIALHDLLDEVSVDAARYFFNSRSATSPVDFDLDLAVREDSENPVYYVQYAHARICTLIARLAGEGYAVPKAAEVQSELLSSQEETSLIRALARLPEEIHAAARDYDPSRINRYLVELAGEFHRFYSACRIKGETPALLAARLKLADSVRSVLANCLGLLGVTAPEKM